MQPKPEQNSGRGSQPSVACYPAHRYRATTSRPKAMAGRMDARLMAIVAEGDRGRVYLDPTPEDGSRSRTSAKPEWNTREPMSLSQNGQLGSTSR